MPTNQHDLQPGVDGSSPETEGAAAPELTGFIADDMSRSVPKTTSSNGVDQPADAVSELSSDEMFGILSNRRRRLVLYYLKDRGGDAELGTLATQIAAWETEQPVSNVSGTERKRVYTSLQQVHLPKIDAADIVEFDKRAGTVSATSSLAGIEFDPRPSQTTDQWHQYYLALAGLNAAPIGLLLLDIWPAGTFPLLAWMATGGAALLVLSVVHMRAAS